MLNRIRWNLSVRILMLLGKLIPDNVKFHMSFVINDHRFKGTQDTVEFYSPDVQGDK